MSTSNNNGLRQPSRLAQELLGETDSGKLPIWIRAPKAGPEHYTGFGRSKLYELHSRGKIDSRSIREPGQVKGTRLFRLASILGYIESCNETEQTEPESQRRELAAAQ